MNVLVTSASSDLGRVIADGLGTTHPVLLSERQAAGGETGLVVSALGSDLSTNLLVRGIEVIVHVGERLPGEDDEAYLDSITRGTYNLLWAAAQEGVRRVVFLSSLALMSAYDEDEIVTERWRPRPTKAMPVLGKYMGELVCREFAREHKLEVIVLRLGNLVKPDISVDESGDAMGLDRRDLVAAVSAALDAPAPIWTVLHVQSRFRGARFSIEDAQRVLGIDGNAHGQMSPRTGGVA